MTSRLTTSLMMLIFCLNNGIADDKQPKTKTSTTAADESPEKAAKRKANEAAQATVKNEFEKIADLTYPKVIDEMGGRKKMIETMKIGLKEMKLKGVEFLSAKVEDASPLVKGGSEVYTIVPTTMELKVRGGRLTVRSYLLGISADKGKTWTFVDGSGIGNDRMKAEKLLPMLPAKLQLPAKERPVLHKDE